MGERTGFRATAESLGITVEEYDGTSWEVASDGDRVILGAHPDQHVLEARAWEGIAQCLLIRSGARWTTNQALALAAHLRLGMPTIH